MALEGVLQGLLILDNHRRKHAEAEYEHLKQVSPAQVVQQLVEVAGTHQSAALRSLSAVLLRSIIVREQNTTWRALSAGNKQAGFLLQAVCSDQDFSVRRKLGDVIAVVAAREDFPALFSTVSELSYGDAEHKQLCMFLVDRIAEYCPTMLASSIKQIFELAVSCLRSGIPRLATAAACAIVSLCYEAQGRAEMHGEAVSALGEVCSLLSALLTPPEEFHAQDICVALRQLAEDSLPIVHAVREALLVPLFMAMRNSELEDLTRVLCTDLMVYVCVAKNALPLPGESVQSLVDTLLHLLCEVENDDNGSYFVTQPDNPGGFADVDDYETEEVAGCAAVNLERVALRLDADAVALTILRGCAELIASTRWQQRRAGLFGLSLCAEGCHDQLQPHLEQIVPRLLLLAEDIHPRVRYSLFHCLGQLATDFRGPSVSDEDIEPGNGEVRFNELFGAVTLQVLVEAVKQNARFPRILVIVLGALSRICQPQYCSQELLSPFAQELFNLLHQLLQDAPYFVQEQAVLVLGNVAVIVPSIFSPFYTRFAHLTLQLIFNSTDIQSKWELGQLRGQALEALALMGKAVGKETFMPDALRLLEVMADAHEKGLDFSDPLSGYMMQTCARIAGILKQDFMPFLGRFLPPLLERIRAEVSVRLLTEEDAEKGGDWDEDGEDGGCEVYERYERGVGKIKIVMNTSHMQEKELACRTLYQYILDLGILIQPFWRDIVATVIPLLQWEYTEGVRMVASWTLPRIFETCLTALRTQLYAPHSSGRGQSPLLPPETASLLTEMMHESVRGLVDSIDTLKGTHEMVVELLSISCDSLRECLKLCKEFGDLGIIIGFDSEMTTRILVLLRDKAAESMHRQYLDKVPGRAANPEEVEEDLLTHISDGIGWVIKSARQSVTEPFRLALEEFLLGMLDPNHPPELQSFSLCLLIDAIEFANPTCEHYTPLVLPHIVTAMKTHADELGQTCVYGIGVLAQYGGPYFVDACSTAVNIVNAVVQHESEEDHWLRTRDNAYCTMLKLALYRSEHVNSQELLVTCLPALPLRNDVYEAQEVHSLLLREFQATNSILLGPSGCNVPEIMRVLLIALGETERIEGCDPEDWDEVLLKLEDRSRVADTLSSFLRNSPPEFAQQCVNYAAARGVPLPLCLR